MKVRDIDKQFAWHPYTQMKDWLSWENRVISAGKDFSVIDEEGSALLDGVANMWCNVWGHGQNNVTRAMVDQIQKIPHSTMFGLTSGPSASLSSRLVGMADGMARAFFTDNGSSAVEASLKIALQYWHNLGRKDKVGFISLQKGYHGDTAGAMSVGYIDTFFGAYRPILFHSVQVPTPLLYRSGFKDERELMNSCLDALENVMKNRASETAALIMESGAQIAGGIVIYPPGFQKAVSELCDKYEVLLILDEIATGFGRLGHLVEYVAQESRPDIVCFGKALTAGYFPLAATLTTREIFEAFDGDLYDCRQLFHGHTFSGHNVGCAAALANLEMYEERDLIGQINLTSSHLSHRMEEFRQYSVVGDVRQAGLLAGIELTKAGRAITKLSNGQPVNYFIMKEAQKMGVFLRPLGNIMLLIPSLAIGKEDLDRIIDVELALTRQIDDLC